MTDQNPRRAGDADEPTARQPAVPPEPATTPLPETAPPPAPSPPPAPAPAAAAAPPPRQPWRGRRVPLLVVVAALLVGCLCGGATVAAVGFIARVADRDIDRVRVVERPGDRWRDNRDLPRPGFEQDGRRPRQVPAPAEPPATAVTPAVPAPATSS